MRKLWAEPVIDYAGSHHRIDRAGFQPLPSQSIPIWFGGFAPVAFKRAAAIGDGFIFGSGQEQNLQAFDQVQQALEHANRDPASFGFDALLNYQSGPDAWREEIEAWQTRGAGYVSMRAMALRGQGDGLATPQAHIDALETYWHAVGDLSTYSPQAPD